MAFEQVFADIKKRFAGADAQKVDGFLAVQVNLTGKTPGTFYIEVKDGNVNVEPYEYIDHTAIFTVTPTNFKNILAGKLDIVKAYQDGKLAIEGDAQKALTVINLVK